MTDILSKEEIEALLNAIATGNFDTTHHYYGKEQRKVTHYDFRRPEKYTEAHLQALRRVHKDFAAQAMRVLSGQLGVRADVQIDGVHQLTYEEFLRTLPNPTALGIIAMDPLGEYAALEIDPALACAMIDLLCGGTGDYCTTPRALTDVGLSIMEFIFVRLLGELRQSWSGIIDLLPRLMNIEPDPRNARLTNPDEMIVSIAFSTKVGPVEGVINLCLLEKACGLHKTVDTASRSGAPPAGKGILADAIEKTVYSLYRVYPLRAPAGYPSWSIPATKGLKIAVDPNVRDTTEYEQHKTCQGGGHEQ